MSDIVRISKHDQELLEVYLSFRIGKVMNSNMDSSTKSSIVKGIMNESTSEQIHFIINQICIDNDLTN